MLKTSHRFILQSFICVVISAVFTLALVCFMHRQTLDVVYQWKQDPSIPYDGRGPYYLSIVETDTNWRGFPIHIETNHIIYVGRDSGKPGYGHMIDYSFHTWDSDLKTFLSKSTVNWSKEGVELQLESGHKLFIPEKMFTGGR